MSRPPQLMLFETTDLDEAHDYLTKAYGSGVGPDRSRTHFQYRHTRVGCDTFTIDSGTHNGDIAYTAQPLPSLLVLRPRNTVATYRSWRFDGVFGPGEPFLATRVASGTPFSIRWRDRTVDVVVLPFAELARVAQHEGRMEFNGLRPVTEAAGRHLNATIDYVSQSLTHWPAVIAEPLAARTVGELLCTAVLTAFPNTAMPDPTVEERKDGHPQALRRAMAFIDDNAGRDITVTDIAEAAHISVRALQTGFRRYLGTTPMGYLSQVRLHHAHRELLAADPASGATVTQAAARWGFFHAGRFARQYREIYGCAPRTTLRRDPS